MSEAKNERFRILAGLVFLSLAGFVLPMGIAMARYPGGTWMDRNARGHSFFDNFFCDLTSEVALSGEANSGAPFAKLAMIALSLGLLPFWFIASELFAPSSPRLAKATRAFGLLSTVGCIAVPIFPSQRYGHWHAAMVFLAGMPGLLAGIFATIGQLRQKSTARIPGSLALITLVLVALDGTLYALDVAAFPKIDASLLATLQKLGAMTLAGWMISSTLVILKK